MFECRSRQLASELRDDGDGAVRAGCRRRNGRTRHRKSKRRGRAPDCEFSRILCLGRELPLRHNAVQLQRQGMMPRPAKDTTAQAKWLKPWQRFVVHVFTSTAGSAAQTLASMSTTDELEDDIAQENGTTARGECRMFFDCAVRRKLIVCDHGGKLTVCTAVCKTCCASSASWCRQAHVEMGLSWLVALMLRRVIQSVLLLLVCSAL